MKFLNICMLICVVIFLPACSHSNGSAISYSGSTVQRESTVCSQWKELSMNCETFNRDYHGIERVNKIAACMRARGFPKTKSAYCN